MAVCNYDDDDGNYFWRVLLLITGGTLDYTELLLSRKKEELFTRRQPFRQGISFEAIVNGGKEINLYY
jgi:hypothetical protein